MKFIVLLFLSVWLRAQPALACSVCFGQSDGPLAEGANTGVVTLLGVTGVMLFGFAMFFIHLRKKASMYKRNIEGKHYGS